MRNIVAIGTPMGLGGIGIVRISGADAFGIAQKVLYEKDGTHLDISKQEDRKMRLCRFKGEGVTDKVMCVFFYAPHSYTGENVVEIQMHGSSAIASAAVRAIIASGAEGANAGEFTQVAYMNGKIDLTEAEGIIDLIEAESEAQINAAYAQSEGALKNEMSDIFNELTGLAAKCEAAIDYPEEDLEQATTEDIEKGLNASIETLERMKEGYNGGAIVREGARVVLAGETNVGKSQLLNRLLGKNRAIVSAKAGTTRDTIEESFVYKGMKFMICDTAGIRDTNDEIEKIGVGRTLSALESADIIVAISEAGKPFGLELPKNKKIIYVQNKKDILSVEKNENSIALSALTGENIDELKDAMFNMLSEKVCSRGASINNNRQFSGVIKALECLTRAKTNLFSISLDCIVSDIMQAATHIGEIIGKNTSEEVIREIFARFCVGK